MNKINQHSNQHSNHQTDDLKTNGSSVRLPELLAPAGQPASLNAAIENGANAVYLGAAAFSARARADNFDRFGLRAAIDESHQHSVNVHLAMNTLIADHEGNRALELAWQAGSDGVDALIVQDLGLAWQLKQHFPEIPLHASTQMTIGDEKSLDVLVELGFKRVILPRELNLDEIAAMVKLASARNLETEVFIHGALCCSYSGQCFLSQLQGGRSGNRGDCAQPCRLAYRLQRDSKTQPLEHDTSRLALPASEQVHFPWLSPRDQALWQHLPDLLKTGVHSLKIEGRMKDAQYVAAVTRVYRELLDGRLKSNTKEAREDINQRFLLAFNRGGSFTDRHLTGDRYQSMRAGAISGSFGLPIGSLEKIDSNTGDLLIRADANPRPLHDPIRGDVLVIRRDHMGDALASAPIGQIHNDRPVFIAGGEKIKTYTVSGFHPQIARLLKSGDHVYLMTSNRPELNCPAVGKTWIDITVRLSFDQKNTENQNFKPELKTPADHVSAVSDQKREALAADRPVSVDKAYVTLTAVICRGPFKGLSANVTCQEQEITPLNKNRMRKQLAKTGQTPFYLNHVDMADAVCLSIGEINKMRRDVTSKLAANMVEHAKRNLGESPPRWPYQTSLKNLIDINKSKPADKQQNQNRNKAHTGAAPAQMSFPALTAYYYRLPDKLTEIFCGADHYVLPLLSLDAHVAPQIIKLQKKLEPDSSCWAFVPAIAHQPQAGILADKQRKLLEWGFQGLYLGRPSIAKTPLQCIHDWGAHIYNQSSLDFYRQHGIKQLSPSTEIDAAQASLLQYSFPDTNLSWQVYGRQRAMSIAICPIGEQHPDCRRCYTEQTQKGLDQAALFSLTPQGRPQRQKRNLTKEASLRLQPHPVGCSCDVYSRQIFAADKETLDVIYNTWLEAEYNNQTKNAIATMRLSFLDENYVDRKALIASLNALRQAGTDLDKQGKAISAFWQAAQKAADLAGGPLEIKNSLTQ